MNTLMRFPGAMNELSYVSRTAEELHRAGFALNDTLVSVATCRDELCRLLVDRIETTWGSSFDLSGLAGLPSGGVTGLTAALHHRPDEDHRSNFVIYGFSHVGVDPNGDVGSFERPGMKTPSTTCGSLAAARGWLQTNGDLSTLAIDTDPEQSRVVNHLAHHLDGDEPGDMIDMAVAAVRCIEDEIDRLVYAVKHEFADQSQRLAIFTGVQIHTPSERLVWPSRSDAAVNV